MAVAGQYTWTETANAISLSVPLKGCSPSRVDIYATDSIVKVNYAPFLIDITLKHTIKPDEHKARVKNGVLNIVVQKEHVGIWGQLEADESEDVTERRNQSILRQQEAENQKRQKQIDRKHEDSRKALRNQMGIEENERQLLDDLKLAEKQKAEEEMYAALAQLSATSNSIIPADPKVTSASPKSTPQNALRPTGASPTSPSLLNDIDEDSDLEDRDITQSVAESASAVNENSEFKPPSESTMFDDMVDLAEDNNPAEKVNAATTDHAATDLQFIPPPRSEYSLNNKHAIEFTPRIFPTPLRESKVAEEEDWMARNRQYLKTHGVLGKHISRHNGTNIEDEDPTWLKAKGDDFYRSNDFRSAANAYSAALDIDPTYIPCLVNRSACYLQIGEAVQCVADCTSALQLLAEVLPPVDMMGTPMRRPDTTKQEVKVLARRAAAHCRNEDFQRAVEDYRAALSIVSVSNAVEISAAQIAQLRQDLQTVELLSVCDGFKKAGDLALSHGDVAQAMQEYTSAIEHIPTHIACLSNRAACYLANEDYEASLGDCALALELLQQPPSREVKATGIDLYTCIAPAPGSSKRKQWVLRTLTRKAACLVKLHRIDEAIDCYTMAVSLSPHDEKLAADLKLLQSFVLPPATD